MKILVTGGAGFIGLNFIKYTLETHPGDEIVCLDKLTYAANPRAVERLQGEHKIEFIQGDITDRALLLRLFGAHPFGAVLNFAAETHVDRSIKAPELFIKTNILGTQALMDMCVQHGVSRFHQVSTDEVYGTCPPGAAPAGEGAALSPTSPYAATKAAADLLALSYFKTYGLRVTVGRSSNNYGPHQHPEKLIPLAVSRALCGRQIPIYGTGENRRSWLYVKDHCRATDLILRRGRPGEVYNIAPGGKKANLEVVRAILKQLGKSESLIRFVKNRRGHDVSYRIDTSKIENDLGWRAETDFDAGLFETVSWYRENQSSLKEIIASPQYREYFRQNYGFNA